ncbi:MULTISPECIES: tRNA (adenosine(37)-N6)-threonylcarbamoyltransferase complex ATPase subunit type 1 TsaE [unclassified Rickettsia]|uniref:tRNA (adenosine(37)-N6)-threonylcarbamoyltransferase complex ATPase subunit type 1 TsaE n=1 Tax=unclassified Rickettsia TaxID=114295 RepID=UPI00209F57ED|nr:tRNA (adenosine(37)-N6)-threonylcarbamoyltransferase complex ATPase subunit type 1 TsaE [Rickettsia endosymbiont of Ceutorhynchus assimilis]
MLNHETLLNNEEESKNFAKILAQKLSAGSVVLFTGDLGSGKTFLCREIIKYFCGSNTEIISPTFNILQTYQATNFTIYHFDLYRLKSPAEIYELGIEDALQGNLCLIEWPEIIEHLLPKSLVRINLQITQDNKRRCIVNH